MIVGGYLKHDRWWLSKGGGLRIGTSFNSLGKTQDSSITRISGSEAEFLEIDVDQYLIYKKREYNSERLRYLSFTGICLRRDTSYPQSLTARA